MCPDLTYLFLVNFCQVLELPGEVVTSVPPSSDRPASAYKAAVDEFLQKNSSFVTEPEEEETSFPDVPESRTRLLQQLMSSAQTLTARQDLLHNLRSDSSRLGSSAPTSVFCGFVHVAFSTSHPRSDWLPPLRSLSRQHLLVHTARSQGYSKLMLGDHCTRLAVKLLTSISLGRGAQLAQDTVGQRVQSSSNGTFAVTKISRFQMSSAAPACVHRASQTSGLVT